MADIEVHIDFAAGLKRVGTLHRHARRRQETTSFEYHPDWLADKARFSLSLGLGSSGWKARSNTVTLRKPSPINELDFMRKFQSR
jgi:HipA N-terminal domain